MTNTYMKRYYPWLLRKFKVKQQSDANTYLFV